MLLWVCVQLSRLICVDERGCCEGIVSWRDVAKLFVSLFNSIELPPAAAASTQDVDTSPDEGGSVHIDTIAVTTGDVDTDVTSETP
jgi:hypothetical protein